MNAGLRVIRTFGVQVRDQVLQYHDARVGWDEYRGPAPCFGLGDGRNTDVHDESVDCGEIVLFAIGVRRVDRPKAFLDERKRRRIRTVQQELVEIVADVAIFQGGGKVGEDGRDRSHVGKRLEFDVAKMWVGEDE